MKAIQEAVRRVLRGPRVSRFLESLGIDPKRYWLLMDLFGQISERGEMLDQLGRNELALKAAAWFYVVISGFLSFLLLVASPPLATYFSTFLVLTSFLLPSVLLLEGGNSLVNPVEGLVLAHQPINGATYTAAKLSHLVRIVLYLAPGLNVIPAFAGLLLKEAGWSYPFLHLLAALAIGFVAAFLCCALYGWLMRFVPPLRLKAIAQLAGVLPFVAVMGLRPMARALASFGVLQWLPTQAAARWAVGLTVGAAAVAIAALGIRSLSADYLIRVTSMVQGGSAAGAATRRSWLGGLVARLCGGQPSRAGFLFVSRMARRDFQFLRQAALVLVFGLIWFVLLAARGWRTDPLSGRFTTVHLLPHMFGLVLFYICSLLPYGDNFKGAWTFLLAPTEAFGPFARGVYAALWIHLIAIPNALMLLFLAWAWGMWHAGLFVAYSLAISSVYLALELRLINGVPFSKQVDPKLGAAMLPVMIMGGLAVAIAVGVQYFFVFRSPARVAAVTVVTGVSAYYLTRSSLGALEGSFRYSLGLLSAESGTLYQEIDI